MTLSAALAGCSWTGEERTQAIPDELAARTIVFTIGDDRRSDLYVAQVDGSDRARLTDGPGFKYDADWSPDGSRIAYRFEPRAVGDGLAKSYLLVVGADGSGSVDLSRRTGVEFPSSPTWAPYGSRIAISARAGRATFPPASTCSSRTGRRRSG